MQKILRKRGLVGGIVSINKILDISGIPAVAIFMSGSGSNAEKLLESVKTAENPRWKPAVIVTDAPEQSRAVEIADAYNLPLVALDIRKFYRERGESRISLATERGREIREEWTNELRKLIEPYNISFGVLAGFVPLSNITSDFPCLNVHPGDLTVEKDGRRLLVGLHTIPVELAILEGLSSMRSSVIIAQTYTGAGGEMDSGPILGVSAPVKIDFKGHSLQKLKEIAQKRDSKRPVGGYKDLLEEIADYNQGLLKENGDWVVFPPVVDDFAAGNFGLDEDGCLHYLSGGGWEKVKTVVYDQTNREPVKF
jgi:folate-dependent phosphoribosylglycinamide formyltransferase PurN